MTAALVEVRTDCACPDTSHPDGDVAYLRPFLGMEGGQAATNAILMAQVETKTAAQVATELGCVYVIYGLDSWNWTNGTGQPIPIGENLRKDVPWSRILPVANRAAELYAEEVWSPLTVTTSRSSRRGRTVTSTSATKRSSSRRRKPSA